MNDHRPTSSQAPCARAAFPPEAYEFVRAGLEHTTRFVHGDDPLEPASRHVNGRQLCLGLRDYAVRQYGLLARIVLERWGVRRTEDFGRIVFDMVESGLLRKTEDDRYEDFADVYDFDEVFAALPQSSTRQRRR